MCRKGSSSVQVEHWLDEQSNMDLSNSSGEAAEEEKELEDKKMKDSRKVKRI